MMDDDGQQTIRFGEVVVYRNQQSLKWRDNWGMVIGRFEDGRMLVWWVDKRGRMRNGTHDIASLRVVVAFTDSEGCEELPGNASQDQTDPSKIPGT
jgi:hypothetical protein